MSVHVVPENDDREHVIDGDPCPCLPRVRDGVTIHNSYDGREVGEVCSAALDALGCALAEHGHVWTDDERDAFEHAHQVLAMHFDIPEPSE